MPLMISERMTQLEINKLTDGAAIQKQGYRAKQAAQGEELNYPVHLRAGPHLQSHT